MGASPDLFDGAEGTSVHTLCLDGERRGEEAGCNAGDEGSPVHH